MKRTLIAMGIFLIAMTIGLYANDDEIVHIPDSAFKAQLVNYHHQNLECPKIDLNEDGEIQVSEAKAFYGKLELDGTYIYDLTGIKAFKNLSWLDLIDINVTHINLSGHKKMQHFGCSRAKSLVSIDISNSPKLSGIDIAGNPNLTTINLEGCNNLGWIYLANNGLTSIEIPDSSKIDLLDVRNNQLTFFDISNNPTVRRVGVAKNSMKKLDFQHNTNLTVFTANTNHLSEVNIKNGMNHILKGLRLDDNPDLKCITVDDPTYVYANWFSDSTHYKFDPWVTFSTDCTSCMQEDDNLVKIYPNPAEDFLYIERLDDEETDIIIMDITGKVCIKQHLEYNQKQVKIDISNLPRGKYVTDLDSTIDYFIKK